MHVAPSPSSISPSPCRGLELDPTDQYERIDDTRHISSSSNLNILSYAAKTGVYSSIGWIGLLAWAIALTLHLLHTTNVTLFELTVAIVGLLFSATYCILCVAHYQPVLVSRLAQQSDTWLVSIQFTIMTIVVSDILKWDSRILLVWPAWMWCIWTLLLDALTPRSRQHLRYQRRMAFVVITLLFLYPIGISYWIYYSQSTDIFERSIPILTIHKGRDIRLDTFSLLSSQVVEMLIWMGRFLSREIYYPPHALKFIKQKVQYSGKVEKRLSGTTVSNL